MSGYERVLICWGTGHGLEMAKDDKEVEISSDEEESEDEELKWKIFLMQMIAFIIKKKT